MNSLYGEYFDYLDGSFDDEKEKVELTYDVFDYFVPENYSGFYDKRKDKILLVIDISKQALIEDGFGTYLIDCWIQFVEEGTFDQILMLAFYDKDIWLCNCQPEKRTNSGFGGNCTSDIRVTKLIGNEEDPFNVLLCDEVYFNALTEKELTLKALRCARQFIEEKTEHYLNNQYTEPPKKNPRYTSFDQAIKYLQRFFIGSGRMSFFMSEIPENSAITVNKKKNIYYNIGVRILTIYP
jgi:hypothetical protein